jgi:hypothetical protein
MHTTSTLEEVTAASLVKKFLRFYGNIHRSLPLVLILSRMSLLHTLLPYLFKIHFIITPTPPMSSM